MKKRIRRRNNVAPDLDITAFMNLMVILVPFLLITAVFSRITVLDLYLPPETTGASDIKEKFRLELVIRPNSISIYEAASGLSKKIKKKNNTFDYQQIGKQLAILKSRFPGEKSASILLEENIPYDVLVQVMDHVRMRDSTSVKGEMEELFPGISIGDAPKKSGSKR